MDIHTQQVVIATIVDGILANALGGDLKPRLVSNSHMSVREQDLEPGSYLAIWLF